MNAVKVTTSKQWFRIRMLHFTTFTGHERKALTILRSRQELGKVDVWYFEENDKFVGYAIVTPGKDKVLINYLVVANGMRRQSKSGVMMKILKYEYSGRGIFAEVDILNEYSYHRSEREQRKQFFLKHGMKELGVQANISGADVELVGMDCEMTFEDYFRFYAETYNIYTASSITRYKKAEP